MDNKILPIDEKQKETTYHRKKKQLLTISLFLFTAIVIEFFTRDLSKKYTIQFFGGLGKDRCTSLSYFEFYAIGGRYILLFLIYTYVNIPAALSYIFLDCFGVFLNGIIRMFYFDDRPFWTNPEHTPCFCAIDYGNPSTTGIDAFLMFAVFYKSFTYKSKSKMFKFLLFVIAASNIAYIFIIRMLQNIHYMHQLLFGMIIGFVIYYIYFEILEINFDNKEQFMSLLKKWKEIFLATAFIWTLDTYIHMKIDFKPPEESIVKTIVQNCPIVDMFAFDHESYSKSVRIFEFIGCFVGSYLEYVFVFKFDEDKFLKYDVNSENEMYKQTHWCKSLIRFCMFYVLQRYALSHLILGKGNFEKFWKLPLVYGLIFEQIIPLIIHGLCVFLIFKVVSKGLGLTNEKVWEIRPEVEKEENEKMIELSHNII